MEEEDTQWTPKDPIAIIKSQQIRIRWLYYFVFLLFVLSIGLIGNLFNNQCILNESKNIDLNQTLKH